jgi:hypothetical protein
MGEKNGRHLVLSGALFTALLVAWPLMMALAQPQGGGVDGQLQWLAGHTAVYKAQFFLALLIAPAIVYMMTAQLAALGPGDEPARGFGMACITAYIALNSIAYASQAILVPRFIAAGRMDAARAWYFASPESIAYFINQLGYCLWGLGALSLFHRVLRGRGMPRLIAAFYFLSAILSVVAFCGLLLESRAVNSLTLPSGLVLLPVGILTVAWGRKKSMQ